MAEVKINADALVSNSHKYRNSLDEPSSNSSEEINKPERKKLKPIVTAEAIVPKKKSLSEKFADLFIAEHLNDIGKYIVSDVVIPTIKDIIVNSIEMMFYGRSNDMSNRPRRSYYDYQSPYRKSYSTSYNSSYRRYGGYPPDNNIDEPYLEEPTQTKVDYQNVVLSNPEWARDIISELRARIEEYGSATIADLYDLLGMTSSYTDNNWGWDNPNELRYRRVKDGWWLDLPRVSYLND